jgi:hypothetical protein
MVQSMLLQEGEIANDTVIPALDTGVVAPINIW